MTRKDPLDKTSVVQAAAELINGKGPEALTLGHLAGMLGVRTPSLYNHIDGLPGLLRELARLNVKQLAERLESAAMGQAGAAGLLAVAQAYRAYIKENPGLYLNSLRASGKQEVPDPEQRAGEERAVRVVLLMFSSLDLSGVESIHAARGLRSAVHGFATLEIAGGFGLPVDLDESFARLIGLIVMGLKDARLRSSSV